MPVTEQIDLSRPGIEVAPLLLGAVLSCGTADQRVSVRITEVEAYMGTADPGSHAYRGRTTRTATMFGAPGHLYVYRHLGLHHCMNLVCSPPGEASAVLLRAGQIVDGEALAWQRRQAAGVCRREVDLARGPARLTVALHIDRQDDGAQVGLGEAAQNRGLELRDCGTTMERQLRTGPRVGVSGSGGGPQYPWRFWIADDPYVTTYRPGKRR